MAANVYAVWLPLLSISRIICAYRYLFFINVKECCLRGSDINDIAQYVSVNDLIDETRRQLARLIKRQINDNAVVVVDTRVNVGYEHSRRISAAQRGVRFNWHVIISSLEAGSTKIENANGSIYMSTCTILTVVLGEAGRAGRRASHFPYFAFAAWFIDAHPNVKIRLL